MNGLCMDDVLSVMDEIHMVFRLNNNNWLDVNDMLSLVNWLKVDVRLFMVHDGLVMHCVLDMMNHRLDVSERLSVDHGREVHHRLRFDDGLNVGDGLNGDLELSDLGHVRRSVMHSVMRMQVSIFQLGNSMRTAVHVGLQELFIGRECRLMHASIDMSTGHIRRLCHHAVVLMSDFIVNEGLNMLAGHERRLRHHANMVSVVLGEVLERDCLRFSLSVVVHLVDMRVHAEHLVVVGGRRANMRLKAVAASRFNRRPL